MLKAIYYGIVFIFGFAGFCFGQAKEQNFINITQQDGLPSNETYCVFKDSRGYIWIATDQGVVRHKGTSMQVIDNLPDNVIFKIREDKEGRIWFFSRSYTLAYFYNEKVTLFKYNDVLQARLKSIKTTAVLSDVYINRQDEIILNTRPYINYNININNGGIKESRYNDEQDSYYANNKYNIKIDCINDSFSFAQKLVANESMFDQLIIDKIKDNDTVKYIIPCGHQNRFQFYKSYTLKNEDIFLFAGLCLIKLLPDGTFQLRKFEKEILSMEFDQVDNTGLIGFKNGGMIKISVTDMRTLNTNFSLDNMSVSGIVYDLEDGIWVTTLENGVYYCKNKRLSKLTKGVVYRMYKYNNSLLFGNNNGIFQINKDSVSLVMDKRNEMIYDIKIDSNKNIIIAGRFDDATITQNVIQIRNKLIAGKAPLIINTSGELFCKSKTDYYFKQGSKLELLSEENNVYSAKYLITLPTYGSIYYDLKKQVCLVTPDKLYQYANDLKSFVVLKDLNSPLYKGGSCMSEMYNGIYCVGTNTGGVILMRDSTTIETIDEKKGLLNNAVKYLLPDSDRLWVATNKGIAIIKFHSYVPLQYSVTNWGENAGLNNLIFYQLMRSGNDIMATTNKGIYQLNDIDELLKQHLPPIPLYITTLNTYKGDTSDITNITLPFLHNRLSVNFDAICYNIPKELKYYYRLLDGEDTTWQNLSGTQVILENLAPGHYELQVKASIFSQGRDSAVQKLSITILKPWWQLNWIRAIAILLFLAIVFLVYRWRVGIIQQKESEKTLLKTQMAELEQTALRAQMNPHFIFNCLTSIQQLVVTGNREEANEYLVKFSRLIRKTLELSAIPYTTIENEKNYLTEYMELEQLRIPGQFDFYFTIDKQINIFTAELPNMMLQPIIENAIRHGIKHLQGKKGLISITMTQVNEYLQCTITDNGVGRSRGGNTGYFTPHKSYGMDIVKKRLAGLRGYNGKNYFIEIVDLFNETNNNPAGTKVILQLPFKK